MSAKLSSTAPWDESRLSRYINEQIEESLGTEYKAAAALDKDSKEAKGQITKDVSAMANSAGGIIIYGLAESKDPARKHLAERIDPINRTAVPKEWLEHVIAQIQPRIVDLRIYPVPLSSDKNHVAYVVEVPQGTTAHQAADRRYYRRHNFEAVPMFDYEIRDVMNRLKTPRIEIEAMPYVKDSGNGALYCIEAWLLNSAEAVTAYDVTVRVKVLPVGWIMPPHIWQHVNTYDKGAKYVLEYALHPGDRHALAKWTAGNGQAPIKPFLSKAQGIVHKHDLNEATFLESEYRIDFHVFARDQAAMDFNCHFSKEQMEKRMRKCFQPSKMPDPPTITAPSETY